MKFNIRHIVFLLAILLLFVSISFTSVLKETENISGVLLTKQTTFEAGNNIKLVFKLNIPARTDLLLHSSYGSTMIAPDNFNTGQFTIPEFISYKKGVVTYTLFHDTKVLTQGSICVTSNEKTKVHLESYIGPPSIIAGGKDYTMQVVLPTDSYDNPMPDSTAVLMKHQFLSIEKERMIYSKDMIGWINIFSYKPSGRLLLFSKVGNTVSKEFTVDVFPDLPENFTILPQRRHTYADGNQITKFITSIIKDEHGNIISDGTLVDFVIKDTSGALLRTQGTTISGQAIAKMLHPDHEETWKVKAYVHGMAESDTLEVRYTRVIEDFDVQFREDNREITIGPLMSFMEQLIPDGAIVKVNVSKEGKKLDILVKTSSKGLVKFLLQEGFYPSGTYDIDIEALGVRKTYKNIALQ
ncbi:hypothetical protein [Aquimarina sp. AU474]|uniref:hypothetical protein n=1 Tax=Aquimarina sp. AU474 TaxID=2108529 RepID=UPI001F205D1B|nr:hypothetical protein [Aquimarina sp. AU474]